MPGPKILTQETAERVYTVPELVKLLDVSRSVVYREASKMGAYRVGTAIRVPQSGLDAYLERQSKEVK